MTGQGVTEDDVAAKATRYDWLMRNRFSYMPSYEERRGNGVLLRSAASPEEVNEVIDRYILSERL